MSASISDATTSEADQQHVSKITSRLAEHNSSAPEAPTQRVQCASNIPSVSLDEGANKYVLVTGTDTKNRERAFVYSSSTASCELEEGGGRGSGEG